MTEADSWGEASRQARVEHIGKTIVGTPSHRRTLQVFESAYCRHLTRPEGTCSFVLGETRAGKTTACEEWLLGISEAVGGAVASATQSTPDGEASGDIMSVVLERDARLERPVIKIPVDPKPSFKSLFSDVVVAVTGTRPPKTMNFMSVLTMLIHQLLAQKTKLLIFDDVQHISEHRGPEGVYKAADVFKVLMKSARMQIVLIGLPHAREIMLANTQLHEMTSRVHQVSPFVLDGREGEFVQFLEAIEGELPFDEASDISGDEVAVRIHHATDGYVGRISHLLIDAVDYALEEGLGRLDRTALAGMLRDHRGIGSHLNPFLLEDGELKEFAQTIHAERSRRQRAAEDRQTRTAGVRQRRRDLGVRGQ